MTMTNRPLKLSSAVCQVIESKSFSKLVRSLKEMNSFIGIAEDRQAASTKFAGRLLQDP